MTSRRQAIRARYSSTTSVSPSLTAWPSSHRISATVPESSASTGLSIFIDPGIATVSPSCTLSPTAHSIFHAVPVICASISVKRTSTLRSPLTLTDNSHALRRSMTPATFVIVVARNEQERIGDTLGALARTFPGEPLMLADDGSTDRTPVIARGLGVRVIATGSRAGKGAAATLALRRALAEASQEPA